MDYNHFSGFYLPTLDGVMTVFILIISSSVKCSVKCSVRTTSLPLLVLWCPFPISRFVAHLNDRVALDGNLEWLQLHRPRGRCHMCILQVNKLIELRYLQAGVALSSSLTSVPSTEPMDTRSTAKTVSL